MGKWDGGAAVVSESEIAAIRERHANGEAWEFVTCDDGMVMVATFGDVICVPEANHPIGDTSDDKNFRSIVDARRDLPALLSHIEELEAEIGRLQDVERKSRDVVLMLNRLVRRIRKIDDINQLKAIAEQAIDLTVRHGMQPSVLRDSASVAPIPSTVQKLGEV